ncbi:hypothetical protein [Prauserella flavalba]|uniref:Integral membrane protein n=1 Tax=Prauserella flavalba TaxID=1477506 RepID=A0A318LA01_9PSEU|nr:hypothetical protein [Prauserella flavalba]PXY18222.1 hypothetical protein BA062_35795 [Prauserella flavalba]
MTDATSRAVDASPALTPDERAELDRLRIEVAARRERPPRRIVWRSIAAGVILTLGCLLMPIALLTVWVHNQVADTDRFVATTSPLIREPSVRAAVTDRVTTTVFDYVDVPALTSETLQALRAQGVRPAVVDRLEGLAGPLESSLRGFVHDQVAGIVASPQVAELWERSLRSASEQMNAVLSGQSQAVVVADGQVRLDLAPFINETKQQLVQSGFTVANRIPDVHPTIAITDATTLERTQGAYSLLDKAATWLPWIALALLALGVYVARRHRRALLGAGLGVALAMLTVAAALLVVRGALVNAVPPRATVAAGDSYDLIVRFLRDGLRLLFVVSLVVALGAFLTGPSATAVGIRRGASKAIGWLRGGGARAGLRTGPVGPWVHAHLTALRFGLIGVAVLVFVFLNRPSGLTVLVIALILVFALGVLQFLDQPRPADDGRKPAAPA